MEPRALGAEEPVPEDPSVPGGKLRDDPHHLMAGAAALTTLMVKSWTEDADAIGW